MLVTLTMSKFKENIENHHLLGKNLHWFDLIQVIDEGLSTKLA